MGHLAQSSSHPDRGEPFGLLFPSCLFSLWISEAPFLLIPQILQLSPPTPPTPPAFSDTVTSELKYSWKHRPCLVNFMSRFSAQMTSLLFFQRLLPVPSLCREPVLPRDVPQGPDREGRTRPRTGFLTPALPSVGRAEPVPEPWLAGLPRARWGKEPSPAPHCRFCRDPRRHH